MSARNRRRQLDELQLVQSMFPQEFITTVNLAEETSEEPLTYRLHVDRSTTLGFTLPERYPISARPEVTLEFAGDVDNSRRRVLRDQLHKIVGRIDNGSENLDEIIMEFQTTYDHICLNASQTDIESSSDAIEHSKESPALKVTLLWTHHLLSTAKRKFIVSRSAELCLCGLSKPGYPGVILVEGPLDSVDMFVRELKGLRWQAIAVRAEMTYDQGEGSKLREVEHKAGGALEKGITEVETMGQITSRLHNTGLESWFLDGFGVRR